MNFPQSNLFSFAFVDVSMILSTMTLKYGRHFDDNDQPQAMPPFQDSRLIVLRGPADGDWRKDTEQVDFPLMAEWPSARQTLANIGTKITEHLAGLNLQFSRVYLESLKPGGVIGWHADESAYAKVHQRFRLLVSPCSGGCWFSGGESLAPGVGNLTYCNNRVLNSAINLGPVSQISLVIDVRRPQLQ
jgi:hypothetical protein